MTLCPDLSPEALAAANVNPVTGLATDYLNHFNEVAMLVDMLSGMPDVADEVLAWRPRSYADHFRITGYRGAATAIAAYETANPLVREAFDGACQGLDATIAALQARLAAGEAPDLVAAEAGALYALIAEAGAIINGAAAQDAIDALFD